MTTLASRVDAARRIATGRTPIFYGWWIVVAGFGTQTLNGALLFHAFGTYVVLLQDDFGWSRTALAGAFAMQRVESGLLGPLQGWMIDTWGPRRVMVVGMVIFGIGFIMLSRIESLPGFYLAFLVIAIGSSLGTHFGVTVAVVHWFQRHRAMAGAADDGHRRGRAHATDRRAGDGGVRLAQRRLRLRADRHRRRWSRSRSWCAIAPRTTATRSTAARRPNRQAQTRANTPEEVSFTVRQALRTRAFWFLAIGHGMAALVIGSIFVHFQVYSNDSLGFSLSAGAFVILLMTVTTVVGQLGGGYLADRTNKRLTIVFALLGQAVSLVVLALASSYWMLIVFAIFAGVGWGARVPAMQAMRAEYFGGKAFGTIMGFSSLVVMFGMILGPLFAGFVYDVTGSYRGAFMVLSGAALVGAVFFWLAVRPAPPVALGDAAGASVAQGDAVGASPS